MNVHTFRESGFEERIGEMLRSSSLLDPEVLRRASEIVEQVRSRGDEALAELARRFDGADLDPSGLRADPGEAGEAPPDFPGEAVREALENILGFSRRAMRRDWEMANSHGARVGEKFDPLQRVGIYVPGGSAPLVSTALMTVALARSAGCPRIAVCTPCDGKGRIHPGLLHALRLCGATEIFRVGGAQAVAAMALGTESIAPVDKVFGPGNAYVVAAKRLLYGEVAVDLLPGPSEVLILADGSARPEWVAADLLAQAEHGSGRERVALVTPDGGLLEAALESLRGQLERLDRNGSARRAIEENGWFLQTRDLEEAIAIANRYAPEHCQVMTADPRGAARGIRTAGALLLGHHSPAALGDYVAGPSHVLPTGGAARGFSGLRVEQFLRRTSIVEYGREELERALPALEALSLMEGLQGHGRSAAIRFDRP